MTALTTSLRPLAYALVTVLAGIPVVLHAKDAPSTDGAEIVAQGEAVGHKARVAEAVSEKAAKGEVVDVLVLLDDAEDGETLRAADAEPLHVKQPPAYQDHMEQRAAALAGRKGQVLAELADAGLESLTDYSVLPVMHLRVHSAEALEKLAGHPKVLSVDENLVMHTSLNQSLPLIHQPDAAAQGYTGAGATVCVLDTGTNYTRSDFGSCSAPGGSCKVVVAQDFAPEDGSLDDNGHGTNVSAIVLGVAPGAKVAALDVFQGGSAYSNVIINAINWCISNKATYNIAAINMSLGGSGYTAPLPNNQDSWGMAMKNAMDAGIVVVAASGNEARTSSISIPAAYEGVVSVGAVYDANLGGISWSNCADPSPQMDQVTCFSNSASFLTMLAPGALSTAGGYTMGGTSQATPHVAGAAAVLRAALPGESSYQLAERLQQGPMITDSRNGITKPRLDLTTALNMAALPQTVQFGAATYSVSEAGTSLNIPVARSGGTSGTVTVQYATANGTATAGSDYTARSGTLTFAAGVTSQTINVPITNDTAAEGNETFTVALSNADGADIGARSSATVTIQDNDTGVGFAAASVSTSEAAGSVSLQVRRVGSLSGSTSVTWATKAGTALATSDFTARTGTLTWAAGDGANKTISIPLVNNTTVEPNETFTVSLGTPSGAVLISGGQTATVTIVDDEKAIQLASATASVGEGAGVVNLVVKRVGNTAAAASVNYATANGTATAGSDYTAQSGTLSWAAGDASNRTIAVSINPDTVGEGNETFSLNLSGVSGAVLMAPTSTTVTIVDDDSSLSFQSATGSVTEGTASITLLVKRVGGTSGTASVNYATVNGTALAGTDYTARSGTLTWAAGDAASKSIVVPILNDTAIDGTRTFNVVLSSPGGATLGSIPSATVSVLDNERGLGFAATSYTVTEGTASVNVVVKRLGSTSASASVRYATAAGTAQATSDFTSRSGTLSWAAGDASTRTISIPIVNNTVKEGVETFTVQLSSPSGATLVTSKATVTINDND